MNNYKKAFTEVYTILSYLDEEEYNKIPHDVLETISQNRDKSYQYELLEDIELRKQPMLPETKAILFNIFRDYLSTPTQRVKIMKIQQQERYRNELKKKQKYDVDVFKTKR